MEGRTEPDCHLGFPCVEAFSRSVGVPASNLIRVFEIEREFHLKILAEEGPHKRRGMYADVYSRVHPLLRPHISKDVGVIGAKSKIVLTFQKELHGKSVLDLGCGTGDFLEAIDQLLPHGPLVGVDVDVPAPKSPDEKGNEITFVRDDITSFSFDQEFDVVFSNNVVEHIAPSDLPRHLQSIRAVLKNDGRFIFIMPNRLFGPTDVTRVLDFSYSGKTPAMGTHLNESTYTEMIEILSRNGFEDFWTVLPFGFMGRYGIRIRPTIYQVVERSRFLLALLYRLRFHARPVLKLPISLVCRKS